MGTYIHTSITVTTWDQRRSRKAAKKARSLGLLTSGIVITPVNSYATFSVFSNGAKAGSDEGIADENAMKSFTHWLRDQVYADDTPIFEWVCVVYGRDHYGAAIVCHGYDHL